MGRETCIEAAIAFLFVGMTGFDRRARRAGVFPYFSESGGVLSGAQVRGALPPFPTPTEPTISHPVLRMRQLVSSLCEFSLYF